MSWPKAAVRLPPPMKSGSYTVTVIGYDFRPMRGVNKPVQVTNGEETIDLKEGDHWAEPIIGKPTPIVLSDGRVLDDPRWKFVEVEPILWVKVRMPFPECERRFEVPMSDVKWINTEAAEHYNIHEGAKVIGIGYGADVKQALYEKEQGNKESGTNDPH